MVEAAGAESSHSLQVEGAAPAAEERNGRDKKLSQEILEEKLQNDFRII